jgi:hypothetical protein
MPAKQQGHNTVAIEERVTALETQLKVYTAVAIFAGLLTLGYAGAEHWYAVPKIATEAVDKALSEKAGAEALKRLKDLNVEFATLSNAEGVADARIARNLQRVERPGRLEVAGDGRPLCEVWNGAFDRCGSQDRTWP